MDLHGNRQFTGAGILCKASLILPATRRPILFEVAPTFEVTPTLKNLLKIKRWQAGLKQYELANQLGCSAPYLSMVENGRMQPPQEFMEKAAEILQIEISKLFPENNGESRE